MTTSPPSPLAADPTRMPMLSFWRPWSEACARGLKKLEYRKRPPPTTIVGRELALHAGQHFDPGALAWLRQHCGLAWGDRAPASYATGVIGVVVVSGCREDGANPDFGRFAWTLEGAVWLAEPLAVPGGQGVRYLTPEQTAVVRERAAAARGAAAAGAATTAAFARSP